MVELSLLIHRGTTPGVYRLAEVAVETYGGRAFDYNAEQEGIGDLGFEVVEEPEEKPVLMLNVLPRSEGR